MRGIGLVRSSLDRRYHTGRVRRDHFRRSAVRPYARPTANRGPCTIRGCFGGVDPELSVEFRLSRLREFSDSM
jgi:hypothetical protein